MHGPLDPAAPEGKPARRVRAGVFRSVAELELAITDYIRAHNQSPKPFIWTAKAQDILAKVSRAQSAMNKSCN